MGMTYNMSTNFERLIQRYANGKEICKCRNAYIESPVVAIISGENVYGPPICSGGCSYNSIKAKEYVADMVVIEFISTPSPI